MTFNDDDFLNWFVFVYLHDILTVSQNLAEHSSHVRQVLQRLLENNLFVKAKKCDVPSVKFLGYIIEQVKRENPGRDRVAYADHPDTTTAVFGVCLGRTLCASANASHRPPMGLLQPPHTWSHNPVTDLPSSQGNTVVLISCGTTNGFLWTMCQPSVPVANLEVFLSSPGNGRSEKMNHRMEMGYG